MYLDVVELRNYYNSPLGRVTARLIRRKIRELWPDVRGLTVLGLGYATPFLNPIGNQAIRTIALMPARQGVVHWPRREANLASLVDETVIPLPDASVDRLVLVHSLEHSQQVRTLLREIWRVLRAGGRLGIVVPNRSGIWARLDRTPFGHGRPYSAPQLTHLLADCMFTPLRWQSALYMPPSDKRVMLRALNGLEPLGERLWRSFAGVLIVEAEKRIYAAKTKRHPARVKQPAFIPR
ncbi:MAG: methyltransferase domain-containing protein [Sphingomonadales bacterium]